MWSAISSQKTVGSVAPPECFRSDWIKFKPILLIAVAVCLVSTWGCRTSPAPSPIFATNVSAASHLRTDDEASAINSSISEQTPSNWFVEQTSYQEESEPSDLKPAESSTQRPADQPDTESQQQPQEDEPPTEETLKARSPPYLVGDALALESVLAATVQFYPEIEATVREFQIAQGSAIQAQGNFDTKLKASSENTPVGFYETYRSNIGIEQPTFNGGSVFAGYRFGRGDFEPWYLERNTNELGELKLGANWALLRGRDIDSRRVAVWQANLERQTVEPVILNRLIQTLRDAEVTYWNWVAAGQLFQLNQKLLTIAESRVDGIEERIKAGDLAEITRTDNDRSILSREVKLLKAKAKLTSAAIKLSLFYRDNNGTPLTPDVSLIPEFGQTLPWNPQDASALVSNAIACRPEIQLIDLEIKALSLDIAKARNDYLPQLNAQVAVSQDFGDPTSASAAASSSTQSLFVNFDEKDEFQVDLSLSLSQSLQRRKASGKVRALTGKLQQLQIKHAFLKEKIEAEVQTNYQLAVAANEQIQIANRTLQLAQQLSDVARERYEDGDVDLFEIILREKQELDSAVEQIESAFNFHVSRANLDAAVGCTQLNEIESLFR